MTLLLISAYIFPLLFVLFSLVRAQLNCRSSQIFPQKAKRAIGRKVGLSGG